MRISSAGALVFLLLLGACGQSTPGDMLRKVEQSVQQEAPDDGDLMCAHGADDVFRKACTIDRTQTSDGLILTLHHKDGGFRRLLVTRDGRGVIAADGAERATVKIVGTHEIEVTVGSDRYRLPATVGNAAKPAS